MIGSQSSAVKPSQGFRDGDANANARGAGVSAKVVGASKGRHRYELLPIEDAMIKGQMGNA